MYWLLGPPGRNTISEILRNIFGRINISIVLDADGLNGISGNITAGTAY